MRFAASATRMRSARGASVPVPATSPASLAPMGPTAGVGGGRAVAGIALSGRSCRFGGCQRSCDRAAWMYRRIGTAQMKEVGPQAWRADVLTRIAEHPVQRLDELLPWNWRSLKQQVHQAA